jgi:serine/threonine-protein kinase
VSALEMPATQPGTPVRSSASVELPRFPAGTIISGRFRIIARLGRGAMGEVYKADDLTLGEAVALKFLADASRDEASELQLLNEVRAGLRVSHPNVCRIHDVGRYEGRGFLSMEYVDGEDLASLLRRIGRLPDEAAVKVATQVCAGLAAAHERGVLHRDLKPGNVMIDGQGRARLTDFGLASLTADGLAMDRKSAGTPAYMAPEQLRGEAASVSSDVYSLGLVLYELFTGHAVFRPKTIDELHELHAKPIPPPSRHRPDLDPAVERVILECLDHDPRKRPRGALEVGASLSGSDPLAAALAAGLTPTPRLVAEAGAKGRVHAGLVMGVLGVFLAGLAAVLWLAPRTLLLTRANLPLSREVLADRARTHLKSLGYDGDSPHRAFNFDYYEEYLRLVEREDSTPARWDRLSRTRPAPIDYWFRQSPAPLRTENPDQRVTMRDPAFDVSTMILMRLAPDGTLREFASLPVDVDYGALAMGREIPPAGPEPDWSALFAAAGLEMSRFTPSEPRRAPPVFGDVRRAWTGTYPECPDEPIRVEVMGFGGKPVAFRIIELKWAPASSYDVETPPMARVPALALEFASGVGVFLGGVILAWRNTRLRRGDRTGALRLALAVGAITLVTFLLRADHLRSFSDEIGVLLRALERAALAGGLVWILYVALEPSVRQHWPETLISWTRLVRGNWRDELVGHHVLLGAAAGTLALLARQVEYLSPAWIGRPLGLPLVDADHVPKALAGGRFMFALLGVGAVESLRLAMFFFLALVLLKLALRRRSLAMGTWIALQTAILALAWGHSPLAWAFSLVLACLALLLAARFGLLALVTSLFTHFVLLAFPLSLDTARTSFPIGLWAMGGLGLLALGAVLLALGVIPKPASNAQLSRAH